MTAAKIFPLHYLQLICKANEIGMCTCARVFQQTRYLNLPFSLQKLLTAFIKYLPLEFVTRKYNYSVIVSYNDVNNKESIISYLRSRSKSRILWLNKMFCNSPRTVEMYTIEMTRSSKIFAERVMFKNRFPKLPERCVLDCLLRAKLRDTQSKAHSR